jgi:tripartite-type tricarboxylate transporter receptor subunit TctC
MVPYRGTAPVVTDLVGGHVQLGIVDPPPSLGPMRAGQIKPIAVSSTSRFGTLPQVRTFEESGLKGFQSTGWFGIVVRTGTPPDIVKKLNAAFVAALKDPEVAEKIRGVGMTPTPTTPDAFAASIKAEIDKWSKVVASAAKKN